MKLASLNQLGISTHTLTWSVTVYYSIIKEYYDISTHTLTWSVTGHEVTLFRSCADFNSHAHVERDGVDDIVSQIQINFNSHAHVERDITYITRLLISVISTHTLTWSVT